MFHPDKGIMMELIHDQWTKDSIYAAAVNPDGKIIAKEKLMQSGRRVKYLV